MTTATHVEMKDLPNEPGVVAYQITAPTEAEVQTIITRTMDHISEVGGFAVFGTPYLTTGGVWLSRGAVMEDADGCRVE